MSPERGWRSRFVDLSLEAVMVVFAVILALNVENWREERQLETQADRIEEAVIAEIRANLAEFERVAPGLEAGLRFLQGVLESGDVSRVQGQMNLVLPDFSSAAWLASESSPASASIDYLWRIEVSQAYETYELYSDVGLGLLEAVSPILWRPTDIDELGGIFGRLVILTQLHQGVIEQLSEVLEFVDDNPRATDAVEQPETTSTDSAGA